MINGSGWRHLSGTMEILSEVLTEGTRLMPHRSHCHGASGLPNSYVQSDYVVTVTKKFKNKNYTKYLASM